MAVDDQLERGDVEYPFIVELANRYPTMNHAL